MKRTHIQQSLGAALVTLLISTPVWADDTEIFFGSSAASVGAPNIMLVLDTSGSMEGTITSTVAYKSTTTYTNNCSTSNIYFKNSATNTLPTCASGGSTANAAKSTSVSSALRGDFPVSSFHCSPATEDDGNFEMAGYVSVFAIRWTIKRTLITKFSDGSLISDSYTYGWSNNLNPVTPAPANSGSGANKKTTTISYTLGDIACSSNDYAGSYPNKSASSAATQWTTDSASSYWTDGVQTTYSFYTGNYLNYRANGTTITQSRLQIVRSAAESLVDSLSGVNVGLMRYDSVGNGGMVMHQVEDVATGRAAMKTEMQSWRPSGDTPLAETLAEAYRYYTGSAVSFGLNSHKYNCTVMNTYGNCTNNTSGGDGYVVNAPSVAASRSGNNYVSPLVQSCQKNHIVFLTDGEPVNDTAANPFINGLSTTDTACSGNGGCLSTLTSYMFNNDLIANNILPDEQNVTTHFIGFGSQVSSGVPFAYLKAAAQAGGGDAYGASDLDSLTATLNEIVLGVLDQSTTFTSPSVAVNAFNKTQVLEDLYVSVFEPSKLFHWPGNIKKYKLRNSMIVGQDDSVSAVDTTTGFFEANSRSYWSATIDGGEATKGGAANLIPDPANRKVYTYVAADPTIGSWVNLTGSTNYSLDATNTLLTDTILDIGSAGDPGKTTLINWARGADTQDEDGDGDTTEARHQMGDPIHSQPAVVIYGNSGSTTTARLNDALVFVATNDGYLHAIDVDSGVEQWAFIPQEVLADLKQLYNNPSAGDIKHYSLDGNLRVLKYDVDNDGVVDTGDGDRVFLYFSMGRGGPNYYALDITNKAQPKYMWKLDSTELGGIVSESWSTPALGRVRVSGATQNPQRLVLIFGGGYDPSEYAVAYNASGDTYGKGVFMVDAVRGTVLWNQTQTATGAFSKMTHAIPGNIAVLDTNGDGWTDRLYAGDMAGQLWRFDITSGNTASSLVTGGVIASLGAKGTASPAAADNRSFYSEPDVAKVIQTGAANYFNISIGSGDRDRPKSNTSTHDRFYGIRDYNLDSLSQADYNSYTAITDSDLTTIDGVNESAIGQSGWKLSLNTTSAEKALAQSITVGGVVMFTTYIPNNGGVSTSCTPSTGTGRSYAVDISTGMKHFNNLYETFATTGLPSQITIVNEADIIRTDGTTASSSSSTSSGGSGGGTGGSGTGSSNSLCLSGVTVQGNCVDFGDKIRTFWRDAGAE